MAIAPVSKYTFTASVTPATMSKALAFYGACIRETTGTAGNTVVVEITDGSGDILLTRNLQPGESIDDWYGPDGIRINGGVAITVVPTATAAIRASARYR